MVSRCNLQGNQLSGNTSFDESERLHGSGASLGVDRLAMGFGIGVGRIAANRMVAVLTMD